MAGIGFVGMSKTPPKFERNRWSTAVLDAHKAAAYNTIRHGPERCLC